MIELLFSESPAGGLKFAKSMKQGDPCNWATTVIGGTRKQRKEAQKPRTWAGMSMEGDSRDVAPLTLALDIGDLSDMDQTMDNRHKVLDMLFQGYACTSEALMETARKTLVRLRHTASTMEPVRIWASMNDPAELCGLYYVCHLLEGVPVPLSVVRVPQELVRAESISQCWSTGYIPAESFGEMAERAEALSPAQRCAHAASWRALAEGNAPLRAVVNGYLMGVPAAFYDECLRARIPQGDTVIAKVIGQTLTALPGVGDRWLYLRLQSMIRTGELMVVSKASEDSPYSGIIRWANSRTGKW